MIVKLFNKPHIIYQTADCDDGMANEALGVCVDNGDTICIRQGSSELVIGKKTVPDLCKILKQLSSE